MSLDKYRDTITAIFRQNMLAVCADEKFTSEERVGTAILCATTSIGAAAAAWQSVSPHLANAPHEAVVRDLMETLMDVLCQQKEPHLQVISTEPRP
jgi:hypothetical protein